jgi:hypothetical protein
LCCMVCHASGMRDVHIAARCLNHNIMLYGHLRSVRSCTTSVYQIVCHFGAPRPDQNDGIRRWFAP